MPSGERRTFHCSVHFWAIFHRMVSTSPATVYVPLRLSSGAPVNPPAVSTSQARGLEAEPPALVVQLGSGLVPVRCLALGLRCHHR